MSDLSAEIKEIEKTLDNICSDWLGIGSQLTAARMALLELKRLADNGAPPERKRGHWIVRNEYSMWPVLCSECRGWQSGRSRFCPECGADMRGEQEPR